MHYKLNEPIPYKLKLFKYLKKRKINENILNPGADLGGTGADAPPPSGIRTPANPKGPPFGTF